MICYDNEMLAPIAQTLENEVGSDACIRLATDPALSYAQYEIRPGKPVELIGGSVRAVAYAAHRFCTEEIGEDVIVDKMVRLRDPCVLVVGETYYVCESNGHGYSVRQSKDLYAWSDPVVVFDADACTDPNFDGFENFWAPELHVYGGQYYIFATYRSRATNHRGVAVFRCNTPDGTYEMISAGHITPKDWDAIDGTLFLDDVGNPWMVFVHEWTSMPDKVGNMSAVRLSADLTTAVGEITALFSAADAPFAPENNVTDGPYLYRFASGRLAMLWSGFADRTHEGYFAAVAYSDHGILGSWTQADEPLFVCDKRIPGRLYEGGHAMLFTDLNGRLRMSLHSPNTEFEAMTFLDVADNGATLSMQ